MNEDDYSADVMTHVAKECMDAIENRDKEAFLDSFHVLVADIMDKISMENKENDASSV